MRFSQPCQKFIVESPKDFLFQLKSKREVAIDSENSPYVHLETKKISFLNSLKKLCRKSVHFLLESIKKYRVTVFQQNSPVET